MLPRRDEDTKETQGTEGTEEVRANGEEGFAADDADEGVGQVPLFTLEPTEHPLVVDQRRGITVARWHELVEVLLHL